MYNSFAVPQYITATDIKRVRNTLGLTQKAFAELVGCSKPTIERWEAGKKEITGPIVLLLQMLENNIEYINTLIVPEKKMPVRLWYMHNQTICTLIDVDEAKREVKINNYTNHVMFKAFGVVDNPSYDEYMEFLKSRCFPQSRDKMKLILKDLEIPFYDPLLIIEKTQGRMQEDDFWIRIDR